MTTANSRIPFHLVALALALVGITCQALPEGGPGSGDGGSDAEARLMERIRELSSDDYGGRGPGSAGEEKTVAYLTETFRSMGLSPGNPDGSYVQAVPLVGIIGRAEVEIEQAGGSESLTLGEDVVAWTKRVTEEVRLDAGQLVFVGYGVEATEYDWNDYEGTDVEGKVLVMLVNDPPAGEDLFGGDAMTYYGRWTYKYEIAAQKGAAGAFIIHETGPAGYPWEVVSGSWAGEQFDLVAEDENMDRVAIEGWFSLEQARRLFEKAGLDFDAQKEAARDRSFRPVPLDATLSGVVRNSLRTLDSKNVVARVEGTEAPEETVLYVAHWDHLGTVPGVEGDNIYNGAYDNATGIAGLLELAARFAAEPPRRSVVFLAVTAEEQGLLGSRFYAEHPLYPPASTVAAINMDGLNIWGPTEDITVVGMGQSSLDDLAGAIVSDAGRRLVADPEPEKGFYYRSDHFELAKVGIPAFYPDVGVDFVGKPDGWGLEQRDKYNEEDYHKPSDEIKDWYDLSGMVKDLDFLFEMGARLANGSDWPEWSETSEFRARREASRVDKQR